MDISLLKTFTVLASTLNFTTAAEILNKTQSTISQQITKLEALLGASLFKRSNRMVMLTVAGEKLLHYAEEMLQLEHQMLNLFQCNEIDGIVSLGTPEDIATFYLPKILSHFTSDYPQVRLSVNCDLSQHLLTDFDKSKYDLIIIKQNPEHPHPKSFRIWQESLSWVSSYKLSKEAPFSSEEIPLILSPEPCVYRNRALQALNQAKIKWRAVFTSTSLTGTIAALKAGLGFSVLPINMIPNDLKLVNSLPKLDTAEIALLKSYKPNKATDALTDFVITHIHEGI